MKKVFYSVCTLMLLALSACNNEIATPATSEQQAVQGSPMTITVSRGDASTKIAVGEEDLSLTWETGDALNVTFPNSEGELVCEKFTLISGAGETSAQFYCANSVLPKLTEDGTMVYVNLIYPYMTGDYVYSVDVSEQDGTLANLGQNLFMTKRATVTYGVMTGCKMDADYVVLKLASGTQLFASSSKITSISKIVAEDLNQTIASKLLVTTSSEECSYAATVEKEFAVSGGQLQSDVYLAFAKYGSSAPNIRVTVTAGDGKDYKDYMFVVSRSKAFTAGNIYAMPLKAESQYINFADENVKALCLSKWDTDGDGKLSYAEAAAVTDLEEVFKGNEDITSFDELQYFTGLTKIPNRAFYDCTALTSVTIPESVTTIGEYAFTSTALTEVAIPAAVTSIGEGAFNNCDNLSAITVDEGNENFCSVDGVLFNKDKTTLIKYPAAKEGDSYTVPDGVTTIGSFAFDRTKLTSITLPDEGLTSIGDWAFNDCINLTSITLPGSVTSIGGRAFRSCSSLTTITCKADTPPSLGSYAFIFCGSLSAIYVPEGSVSTYQGATNWSEYKDEIKAITE